MESLATSVISPTYLQVPFVMPGLSVSLRPAGCFHCSVVAANRCDKKDVEMSELQFFFFFYSNSGFSFNPRTAVWPFSHDPASSKHQFNLLFVLFMQFHLIFFTFRLWLTVYITLFCQLCDFLVRFVLWRSENKTALCLFLSSPSVLNCSSPNVMFFNASPLQIPPKT